MRECPSSPALSGAAQSALSGRPMRASYFSAMSLEEKGPTLVLRRTDMAGARRQFENSLK